jgi:transposase
VTTASTSVLTGDAFRADATVSDEIPSVGRIGAQELIAELGVEMDRFPSAGHLVSWAKFAPTTKASTGKTTSSSTGKGNPWIGATIGEAAMGPPVRRGAWLDARNAAVCPAAQDWRARSLAAGEPVLPAPLPLAGCPAAFGNTDIWSATTG